MTTRLNRYYYIVIFYSTNNLRMRKLYIFICSIINIVENWSQNNRKYITTTQKNIKALIFLIT